MAYIVPIHRPSSVRHALKLNFMSEDEECLVIAKSNRLEIWVQSPEGLIMAHSKAIYGYISMLQKLRPGSSNNDHLFIGTDRYQYFTVAWDAQTRQLVTIQKFVDITEKHTRDSQSLDRCLVDPAGQHMIMELYEGVLNLVKVRKPRKGDLNYLDDPEQVRISELYVRASTFLFTESKCPKLALLYQATNGRVSLATYRVTDEKGHYSQFDAKKDRENELHDLDPGATALIPVPKGEEEQKRYIYRNSSSAKAQVGGLIVVGETRMLYLDDESKATIEYALDEASIFVAWAMYDGLRYLLADQYGWLHLLELVVDGAVVTGMNVRKIGEISTATNLIYLGNDVLYVASHEGDSQVIRLDLMGSSCEVLQTMPNIAPILDFTVMDMGSRSGEAHSNDYATGQARLVTGSGVYKTGSLRSVRSGVGLEDIGLLGEMENIRALYSLKINNPSFADTLIASFLTETRVFQFDSQGEVEELEGFRGISFAEETLLAANLPRGRIIQVTPSRVTLIEIEGGMKVSSWEPQNGGIITAASTNDTFLVISSGGKSLITLEVENNLTEVGRQTLEGNNQIACVHVPHEQNVALVGFWETGSMSILKLPNMEVIHAEELRTPDSAAVPRSIVQTQILPATTSGPTILVAMSDGVVVSFTSEKETGKLAGKKSVVLGVQHANLQVIPRGDGLYNVFATCEHSSLIYGSENRTIYSAVTAEDAICICPFDAEAYPDSVIIATSSGVKISQIDTERRTHVRTLPMGETVRRITYSSNEKAFGLGCVKKELIRGEEIVTSSFRLVDEVIFGELGKPFIFDTDDSEELVECVIRAELPNEHGDPMERFLVGTSCLREDGKGNRDCRGRLRVFGVTKDRSLYEIVRHDLKGACRCLGVLDGKIVAGLVKTVIMLDYHEYTTESAKLERTASYRTATCPIDIDITGNIIAIGDLMKSMSLVEYRPGNSGEQGELVEVARHFQASQTTAVAHIEDHTYLTSDADHNLIILERNMNGVTLEDRKRLQVTSEISLGEMVNKIRKIDVEASPNAPVIPRAFLCTVEGSIYLYASIVQSAQDVLMRLQSRMGEVVESPGQLPFNKYRSFKNAERETEEPFRFVDGELIERFLDLSEALQEEICTGLGPSVEDVRNMIEELKRLH